MGVCQELSVEWIWLCFQQKPRILANKELGRILGKQQQQNHNNVLNLFAGSRRRKGVGETEGVRATQITERKRQGGIQGWDTCRRLAEKNTRAL